MKDALKHVFQQVQLLQYLPESTLDVVKPFVKSWFCHPESLQMCDDNPDARSFIVDKILTLRDGSDFGDTSKRVCKAPPLNFNGTCYLDLIDWNAVPITESFSLPHYRRSLSIIFGKKSSFYRRFHPTLNRLNESSGRSPM